MDSIDQQTVSRRANFAALLRVADIPLLAMLAVAIYFATAYELVDRLRLMPVGHSRLLNSKELLEQPGASGSHAVYFLGSSVVVDGIDCDVVDRELPDGFESFNIGGTGSGPGRWPLLETSLAQAHPAAVVLVVDLASAISNVPMPAHMSALAGWFDFLPRDARQSVEGLLDKESEIEPLFAPRYEQLLAFRVLPLVHLEVTLRETIRKDLRYEGYATNFKAPWIRHTNVSAAAMDRSIKQMVKQLSAYKVEQLDHTNELVSRVTAKMHKEGAQVLVVLAPMNPEVVKQLPPGYVAAMSAKLADGAQQAGAIYLDQADLLPVSGFSDHIHPIGKGRDEWSAALGKAIREALQGDKQPHAVSDT